MAILFQLAIVVLLLCTATFQVALVCVQFTLLLCSVLTVTPSVISLRSVGVLTEDPELNEGLLSKE